MGPEIRVELHDTIPELLEVEAEGALALGGAELPLAEAAAGTLLSLHPYRESDHRLLMRCTSPEATLPRRCSFTNAPPPLDG